MAEKNIAEKIISSILILSILLPSALFSFPKKAEATMSVVDVPHTIQGTMSQIWGGITSSSTTVQTGQILKDAAIEIGKQLLKVAAKQLLARMTQATINWINSDFHGSPLFLENPESFFRDIAKSQVRNLVDMIGYDTFRFPFGKQTALNVISSYKNQFEINAQYSLSKVINDPDLLVRYRNDFNYGGWNGFLINTQYPQNNYLGFNMMVQQNLASRLQGTLQAPAEKVHSLLQQGMGFLSPQTCPSNPKYNNGVNEFRKPSFKSKIAYTAPDYTAGSQDEIDAYNAKYYADVEAEKAQWAETNTCPGGLVSTTPGSVAASQISTALSMPFLTTALDGALGNSLAAIFDALINHFMSKGLNALAETVSPAPEDDNWSYDGGTLSGGTIAKVLNIPTNVSVRAGESTSIAISGGSGNYSIKTPPDATKATASISSSSSAGARLSVTGVAGASSSSTPRTTTVTIQDSSDATVAPVTVNITVNAIGVLAVTPSTIKTDVSTPITATIDGGTGPYSIITGPNEGVAVANLSGRNLIIVGVGKGMTFVTIKDANNGVRRVDIEITGAEDLNIPQNIYAYAGHSITVPISGGLAPYFVERMVTPSAAAAQISIANPSELIITGLDANSDANVGAVIIKDSSSPAKIASATITTVRPTPINTNPPRGIFVSLFAGSSTTVTLSGGHGALSIRENPDKPNAAIATATLSGNTLTITSLSRGTTSVVIQDTLSPAQTIEIPITVK